MICPVEIARDLSAFRAVRVGDHAKHGRKVRPWQQQNGGATGCGKDARWKSPKADFPTSLGNPGLSNPSVSRTDLPPPEKESPEMERVLTRDAQAACDFSFSTSKFSLQKLLPLGCRSFDDLESQIGGFPLEIANL